MKKSAKHPGFKAVQKKIARKSGVSMERAGAILEEFTFTTRCCLCNDAIPYKDIKVNLANKSWSCSKFHAVNGLTKP